MPPPPGLAITDPPAGMASKTYGWREAAPRHTAYRRIRIVSAVKGRPGRTRSRVLRGLRTCPPCPNHVSGVSAGRVPVRSYAPLQDLRPAGSRDAPLRH